MVICASCNCSGSNSGQMLSRVDFLWPSMMIASSAFQAGASIIKVTTYNSDVLLWVYFVPCISTINNFASLFVNRNLFLMMPKSA